MTRPVSEPRRWAGVASVAGAALLWSLVGPHARFAYGLGVTPGQRAALRAGTAWLALAALVAVRGRRARPGPGDLRLLAAAGLGGVGLFYVCLVWSMKLNPVAVASVLLYTAPAYLAVADHLAGRRRLDGRRLLLLAAVLAGVYLVGGGGGAVRPLGVAAGLASGAAYALYTALTARAAARTGVTATLLWALGLGSAVLVPLALGDPWPAPARNPSALALLVAGGIGLTLVPYALYTWALRCLAPADAGSVAALEPVFTAAWGYALLGERLSPPQVLGAACVLAAVLGLVRQMGEG